jgi:hypothetical protein
VNPKILESKTAAMTKEENLNEKKQSYRTSGRRPDDMQKGADGKPMLCFGKGNNFHKFKQVL